MNQNTADKLEFSRILDALSQHAGSPGAKEKALSLTPFLDERVCRQKLEETTEARKMVESLGSPPLASMKEMDGVLTLAGKGAMLTPQQLGAVALFLTSCRRMRQYLQKAEKQNIPMGGYSGALFPLEGLWEEIDRSIRYDHVEDDASPALRSVRRKIENQNSAVKAKLESILKSRKDWFSDGYVSTRNGRQVLPVKKEYKNQVPGSVVDVSNGGGTCFIEPAAVRKLQDELSLLQIEEDNEVRRILYTLTALVDDSGRELRLNMECMETLDFAFAKAKLALEMDAVCPQITTRREIRIVAGRHPLLRRDKCVPLDFQIGGDIRGVVITGPNTGGKTVALKTVGLLSLMAQSGLHVPAGSGSLFSMHNEILCDIGDGQSITENLSTFSSHVTNIIHILGRVTGESLVLMDELGSGTDPAEGMGLAVAVLEELRGRGCLFLVTTHYPEIKEFAGTAPGMINARMEFDRESLKPLYRLQIGEAGESCALYIAQRLGFPEHLLARARQAAYGLEPAGTPAPVPAPAIPGPQIQKEKTPPAPGRSAGFQVGDSVTVYPDKTIGIVFRTANERGELGVQIKGKKLLINHKRVKLLCPAGELYPEDYDFSILFDTVANRKARHDMERKHDPGLSIEYDDLR